MICDWNFYIERCTALLLRSCLAPLSFALLLLAFASPASAAPAQGEIRGRIEDERGGVIPGAALTLYGASGNSIAQGVSDEEGRFLIRAIPEGRYELEARYEGFGSLRSAVTVRAGAGAPLVLTLRVGAVSHRVGVTASRGLPDDLLGAPNGISHLTAEEREARAGLILPQLLREEPGVQLQQTSGHQGAVLIRGLTGQQVLHLIDGVRFNTSTFRPGPNQYLATVDPAFIDTLEISRGPHSTQYGSDSLGGTLNILPPRPLPTAAGHRIRGEVAPFFRSADLAGGISLRISYGTGRWHLLGGGSFRRAQDLRAGRGEDSHSVAVRFLGLPSKILGGRLQDTAFSQWAGYFRVYVNLLANQTLSATYHRGQQLGGRRYDQLNGGSGNLLNSFDPQTLDFFYARYTRQKLGWMDTLEGTVSLNRQGDARRFQGGSGNPSAGVTQDDSVTTVLGYQAQGTAHAGTHHILLFGGEAYHEFISASAASLNPLTLARTTIRPRFPHGSRYTSIGFFLQHSSEWLNGRLRTQAGLRSSGARFATYADKNVVVNGRPAVPDFRTALGDVTYQGGASLRLRPWLVVFGSASRGFRSPNATDYSQVGLTSAGFEVSPDIAAAAHGTLGSNAGPSAVPTGVAAQQLRPERLMDYEGGARIETRAVTASLTAFHYNLRDFLSRRTLLLPGGAVGTILAGETIVQQLASGAVVTAADARPVITRANAGQVRLRGLETEIRARLNSTLTLETHVSHLRGEDRATGLAPDIEGGLPPLHGFVSLRWQRAGKPWWVEAYSHWSDAQGRLSSLELADQRIGATRNRASIAGFFQHGAVARGLVAGGILLATGETLAQVQDRVLGPGEQSAPLVRRTAGFATLNFRGGVKAGEKSEVVWILENALDKNYRLHGSGIDSPGRNLQITYLWRF